jgi:hypothetical protein
VTPSWTDALDEFEARLVLADAVLTLGGDAEPPPAFETPSLPVPFPAELGDRAEALLARAAAVEGALGTAQQQVRAELSRLPRLTPAREAVSRLDVQA